MLSPVKILLLLAVIAAVIVAARFFRKPENDGKKKAGRSNAEGETTTEMIKCPDCDTFVMSLEEHNCKS
jgi:hypothetical protein